MAAQATRLWERGDKTKTFSGHALLPTGDPNVTNIGTTVTSFWLHKGSFEMIESHHKKYLANFIPPRTFSRGILTKYKTCPLKLGEGNVPNGPYRGAAIVCKVTSLCGTRKESLKSNKQLPTFANCSAKLFFLLETLAVLFRQWSLVSKNQCVI